MEWIVGWGGVECVGVIWGFLQRKESGGRDRNGDLHACAFELIKIIETTLFSSAQLRADPMVTLIKPPKNFVLSNPAWVDCI